VSDDRPEMVIPLDRLPPGFAERVAAPPAHAADPKPAATAVLARDGERGPELLLMERHRASGFVPGAWVFPGGRVDDADAAPELVRMLGTTPRGPAAPYWLAMVREVFEETGVLLARLPGGAACVDAAADERLARWRTALLADEATLLDVLRSLDATPDISRAVYCAHWITPVAEPRRYDTRFFAARVPAAAEAVIDPREMTDALWVAPARGVRAACDGELPMILPTVQTLEQLSGFRDTTEVLAELPKLSPPTILPGPRTAPGSP
jgi:8-oxo-dGTP pyrophosphatase MutT (NUDIX family)